MKRKTKFAVMTAVIMTAAMMAGCGAKVDESISGAQGTPISGGAQEGQVSSGAQEGQASGGTQEEQASGGAQEGQASGGAQESSPMGGIQTDKYMTLGDYGSLEVEVDVIGVDEEELKQLMSSWYSDYVTPQHGGIMNRAVAVGDTVFIDYEGKLDGVAFAGGTAKNATLAIGSGQFIAGFEDGLVGVMPGKTVDLNLTFPEGYGSAELAGKAVVFTVTVNCIRPAFVAEKDMEDAVVVSFGIEGLSTVAAFRQYAYDYLNSVYESNVQSSILDILEERCEFRELPADLMESYRQECSQRLTEAAAEYDCTLEQYAQLLYQISAESLVEQYAESYLKQDLMLLAVAEKEGLNVSDEELQSLLQDAAALAGSATVEEFLAGKSKESVRTDYRNEKVMRYLMAKANISQAKE